MSNFRVWLIFVGYHTEVLSVAHSEREAHEIARSKGYGKDDYVVEDHIVLGKFPYDDMGRKKQEGLAPT